MKKKGSKEMKIKNIEKFRTELYKNLEFVLPCDCHIRRLSRTEFEEHDIKPENRMHCGVRVLTDPLMIEKVHYECIRKVVDRRMYIKLHQDCIMFFRENTETQTFELMSYPYTTEYYEDYPTKGSFMMKVAMIIQKFAMKGEE